MSEPVSRTTGSVGNDAFFQNRAVSFDGTGTAVAPEGNAIAQADVSTITRTVSDKTTGLNVSGPTTLTTATVLSNTLTADNIWSLNGVAIDTVGRNFLDHVPGSNFPTAGHEYWISYSVTLTGGTVCKWFHSHVTDATIPS